MSDVDEEEKQAPETSSYSSTEKEEYASSLSLPLFLSCFVLSCGNVIGRMVRFESSRGSFVSRAAYLTSSVCCSDEGVEESVGPCCSVHCLSSLKHYFDGASASSAGAMSVAVAGVAASKGVKEKDENFLLLLILVRVPDQTRKFFCSNTHTY